ncbi:MAG: ParB N-terminal domain-containing protein [Gemmobacter sp.]
MNPVIDQERAGFLASRTTNKNLQLLPQWVRPEKELPVVTLPIEWVRFSTLNHRTRAEQDREKQKSGNSELFTGDPLGDHAQAMQLKILSEQGGFDDLKRDLERRGQQEPAVVTAEGILINGNRRAAALRKLWLDDHVESARYVRAFVLPADATKDELIDLETELQVSKDYREEYSWVNEALLIEEIFESSNKSWTKVSKRMRLEKEKVQEQYEKLQQLHQLVALSNGQRYHADFVENNSAFRELAIHIRGKSPQEAASVRSVYFLGTLAGTNYRDLRHLRRSDAVEFVREEFSNDLFLRSLLANSKDGSDDEAIDYLDDVLGVDKGSEAPDLNQVLSFLAAQKPENIVTLPTGEQVAVDQLLTSVKSAVDAAAKEASENVKDAKAVVAPTRKLDLAKENILRAGAALGKARSQSDWDEGALKAKIEEVKAAISQLESM